MLQNRRFWMTCTGFVGFFALWYCSVKWVPLDSFKRMPDPVQVLKEWLNPNPVYGISIFVKTYYYHILYSTYRATLAFFLAVGLGVPLGIAMGWSTTFRQFSAPLLALLQPVPPLAWIPLAILILPGEVAVLWSD